MKAGTDRAADRSESAGDTRRIAVSGCRARTDRSTDRVEVTGQTCDDCVVPLSEDEQRILRQIEHELEQDPTFADRGYRVSRRRSLLLIAGLLAGLVLTIGGLAVNFVVAFAGFVLVLVMAVMLESELRLLGRERLGQLPISAWLSGRRPDVDDDASH
jgi:Flp pilus assembly protein TadB